MTERDECQAKDTTTIECEGSLLLRSGQRICEAHHRATLQPGNQVTLAKTGNQPWIVEMVEGWDVRLRWGNLVLRVPASAGTKWPT